MHDRLDKIRVATKVKTEQVFPIHHRMMVVIEKDNWT